MCDLGAGLVWHQPRFSSTCLPSFPILCFGSGISRLDLHQPGCSRKAPMTASTGYGCARLHHASSHMH